MGRLRRTAARPEWLGLGDASTLLGVSPGTLRRWSDAGRLSAFTTPGGHRRYRRSALERMLPSQDSVRPALARSGMTVARLARAYRQEARSAARALPWLARLSDVDREWFRRHGRGLAENLLVHLDAVEDEERVQSLRQASQGAAAYGRMAADLGLSLSQAVEGFLQFRRPFLHQLSSYAMRRGLDVAALSDLIEKAEQAMDRLLMSALAGHGVERVGRRRHIGTDDSA